MIFRNLHNHMIVFSNYHRVILVQSLHLHYLVIVRKCVQNSEILLNKVDLNLHSPILVLLLANYKKLVKLQQFIPKFYNVSYWNLELKHHFLEYQNSLLFINNNQHIFLIQIMQLLKLNRLLINSICRCNFTRLSNLKLKNFLRFISNKNQIVIQICIHNTELPYCIHSLINNVIGK